MSELILNPFIKGKLFYCIIITCFYLFVTSPLFAQSGNDNKLQVFLIHTEEDSLVRIRWAPANMNSWYWGIENGYRLSRYVIATNGVPDSIQGVLSSKVVLDSLIKPLPENAWGGVDATVDQIDVAKAALYEESFIVDSLIGESEMSRAFADHSDKESRFIYGLFAADQKFEIAEAMGFAFLDNEVVANKIYYYTIDFLGDIDSSLIIKTGVEVDMESATLLPSPDKIYLEQAVENDVLVRWDVTNIESYYVSYNIERSTDSVTFVRVNELPLVASGNDQGGESSVFYSDSISTIGAWYYYRVKGVTPFGQEGPPSEVIKLRTSHSPKASPPIISNIEVISGNVKVDWSFPSLEQSHISEFRIYRAANAQGPFILMDSVASNIRTWTDNDPLTSGYYRLVAHDTAPAEVRAGDRFIQLDDDVPPSVPTSLGCSIDDEGNVKVTWAPVVDSSLKGYRVFSGNAADATFVEQTNGAIKDTLFSFTTTLKTLTKDLYVRVQSLDERENYSAYSEECLVQRPDKVPPSLPVLISASPLQAGIQIKWINSSSEDIQSHIIQRKRVEESAWLDILEVDLSGNPVGTPVGIEDLVLNSIEGSLVDTMASFPYEYQFRVLAIDGSENMSSSLILSVKPYDSGERGFISNMYGDTSYDAVNSVYAVKLAWEYSLLSGLYDFQIYRSVDGKPMRAYVTTNGRGGVNFEEVALSGGLHQIGPGSFEWQDPELGSRSVMSQSGYGSVDSSPTFTRTFRYKIMARHFDGGWSAFSEEIEVNVIVP